MKKLLFKIIVCFFLLLSISVIGQTSRRNTSKSNTYRGDYQRVKASHGIHTLEIRQGSLWAWGYNKYGELGDGTNNNSLSPIKIGTDSNWVTLAMGQYHSLALKSDGTLWAWGYNGDGELADGTTIDKNIPTQIGTEEKWISMTAGTDHNFAIKADGTLWAWGDNTNGELGDGTTTTRLSPVQVGTDTKWIRVISHIDHSLGLKSDGTLWAWGINIDGRLGDGTTTDRTAPVQVGTDKDWAFMTIGNFHSLGLKANGTLWTWGANASGELGDGTTIEKHVPTQVGTDNNWVAFATGIQNNLGIKSDGTLWAWGKNGQGELGDGTKTQRNSPVQIGTDNNWVKVEQALFHSLGLKADGSLYAWGLNTYGQYGNGSRGSQYTPLQIGTNNKEWISITAYASQTFGIQDNGTLWAWGNNSNGQLGDASNTDRSKSVQVGSAKNWVAIDAGKTHSLALQANGTLWAWGDNSYGQLGNGTTTNSNLPLQVGTENTWQNISAGFQHSLGLKADGTLWSWGSYLSGALGTNAVADQYSPQQIGTADNWMIIKADSLFNIAIKADGTLWAWGNNSYGQLGDGSQNTQNSPIQIGTDSTWVTIQTGTAHSIAIKADGSLWTWGFNAKGALGDGTFNDQLSPTKIGNENSWMSLMAGGEHSGALKANGTLWTWGDNSKGALGDGSNSNGNIPAQIGSDNNWASIKGGNSHSIGFKADRSVTCASGLNSSGQLGDNSFIDKNAFSCKIADNCGAPLPPTAYSKSICSGASATLSALGTGTLGWYTSATGGSYIGNSQVFSTAALNTDTIFYVQDSTCAVSVTRTAVNIKVNAIPTVTASSTATSICLGTQITLSGNGATSYTWSHDVINGQSFKPSTTTTYTVIGTNASNCSASDTITIQVTNLLASSISANASTNNLCAGEMVTLTGSGASTYSWSGGVNDGIAFAPDSTTTYTLIATDDKGCSDKDSIKIYVNQLPKVTINASLTTLCVGDSVSLIGEGAESYSWTGGVINGESFSPPATNTYTLTGTDDKACSDTASITIYKSSSSGNAIAAQASSSEICKGDSVKLYGTGANTYTWSEGIINESYFIPISSKTYTLTGIDANGCSKSDSITILVNTLPIVIGHSSFDTICKGSPLTLSGEGAKTYTWDKGVVNEIEFIPDSTNLYIVSGTDENNCTNTDTLIVNVNTIPLSTVDAIVSDSIICSGDSVVLTGTGAYTYYWTGGVTNGVAFNPHTTNSYTLTGISANACSNTTVKTIIIRTAASISTIATPLSAAVCYGTEVTLKGAGAVSYAWSDNVMDGVPFLPEATNTYTVTAIDSNNCSQTAIRAITVFPLPTVGIDVSPNDSICIGDSVSLTGTGANRYIWANDVMDGVPFAPSVSNYFTVEGKDKNGCENSYTQLINVLLCEDPTVIENHAAVENTIQVYPNPNTGNFTIQGSGTGKYILTNSLGQTIKLFEFNYGQYENYNIQHLSSGIYFLISMDNSITTKQKIIVSE